MSTLERDPKTEYILDMLDGFDAALKRLRAEILRLEREERARRQRNKQFERERKTFIKAGFDALRMIQDGIDEPLAIQRLAALHSAPEATIAAFLKEARETKKKQARAERDRRALQMARKGATNAEIAHALSICPRTVTRIIAKAYRYPAYDEDDLE